ncbi:MAG: hypothetical protein ABSC16_12275 [Candidatus Dormibacteria bacterium]
MVTLGTPGLGRNSVLRGGERVIALDEAYAERGAPELVRCDDGEVAFEDGAQAGKSRDCALQARRSMSGGFATP